MPLYFLGKPIAVRKHVWGMFIRFDLTLPLLSLVNLDFYICRATNAQGPILERKLVLAPLVDL